MVDENGIDDLPVEDSAPAMVNDTNPGGDGQMVGIGETDALFTGEVDSPDPEEVEEEDQHGEEPEHDEEPKEEPKEAPKAKWDPERQKRDQIIANQRKKIEKLEAQQAPEPETETTPEPSSTDFDDLFVKVDKAEKAEPVEIEDIAGELSGDLDEIEQLGQTVKAQGELLKQIQAEGRADRNMQALRDSYASAIKAHDLNAEQTTALHERVQAVFTKRGITAAKAEALGEDQFSDIVERVAAGMQVEALKKAPPTRRRRSKQTTPEPNAGGTGAAARTPGTPTRFPTMDEAVRDMENDPDKAWLNR